MKISLLLSPPAFRLAALALAMFFPSGSLAQTIHTYTTIAVQDDPAPSVGATATYGIMGTSPRIGPGGHVTFGGFVGNNGDANYAIWTGRPGEVVALVVKDDPTPGRPEETLDVFAFSAGADYWPCSDGSVAFRSTSEPSGNDGIWHGTPGGLRAVAIVNSATPGIAGTTIKNFPGLVYASNGEGEVLVRATVEGGGVSSDDDTVLWVSRPDSVQQIAREGEDAPGVPGGGTFKDLTFLPLSINAEGSVCFKAGIATGDIATNAAIFSGSPGSLLPVVQKGSPIPILPSFKWDAIGKPRMNNSGEIVFEAVPKAGGNKSFFVRSAGGDFTRICELDAVAPGAGTATWKGLFFSDPLIGGGDHSAFSAGLGESSNFAKDGVWLATSGVTSLVAKKGDPAHGLAGHLFESFDPPAVNASGIVVFKAKTDLGANGLWVYHGGMIRLIAAVGDDLRIGPSDIRRIASLSVKLGSGGQSGYPSSLNDAGKFVFQASFNSGALGTAIMLIDDLCDLDGGGISCLLEDAFGGDPSSGADDFTILPSGRRDADDFVLTFRRRTDGSFTYAVQSATDLSAWSTAVGTLSVAADQSGLPAGIERVEFRIPIASGGHGYLRVQVSRN
jgi:hypothetical protein